MSMSTAPHRSALRPMHDQVARPPGVRARRSAARAFGLLALRLSLGPLLLAPFAAAAQTPAAWPSKPIRMVVPYPPGGAVDQVGRLLAPKLEALLGQPVIVENKAGAGGLIGSDQVAKSPPDGYSLVMATVSSHAIAPSVYRKMPYDPIADFAPVSLVALTPYIITVHPDVPARTLPELVSYAKANPERINFGSSGKGTTPHLAGELFNTLAGTRITHVAYKGSAPMVTDLLGGQVQVAFDNTVIPHIRSGKLRGIAVTGPTRLASLPDLPTAVEAGLPGYEAVGWMGLMAPAGTPAEITRQVADATAKAINAPDVLERLASLGFQGRPQAPTAFATYLRGEKDKWARVVKDAGIQPE